MDKEKFIELFEDCIDDIDKWKLLIENKDIIQEVSIDNDDVTIILDDDNYINFSIERVQQIIVCKEGIKYTLQKAIPGLGDDCFEVIG